MSDTGKQALAAFISVPEVEGECCPILLKVCVVGMPQEQRRRTRLV